MLQKKKEKLGIWELMRNSYKIPFSDKSVYDACLTNGIINLYPSANCTDEELAEIAKILNLHNESGRIPTMTQQELSPEK